MRHFPVRISRYWPAAVAGAAAVALAATMTATATAATRTGGSSAQPHSVTLYAVGKRACPARPRPHTATCYAEIRELVKKGTPGARAYKMAAGATQAGTQAGARPAADQRAPRCQQLTHQASWPGSRPCPCGWCRRLTVRSLASSGCTGMTSEDAAGQRATAVHRPPAAAEFAAARWDDNLRVNLRCNRELAADRSRDEAELARRCAQLHMPVLIVHGRHIRDFILAGSQPRPW